MEAFLVGAIRKCVPNSPVYQWSTPTQTVGTPVDVPLPTVGKGVAMRAWVSSPELERESRALVVCAPSRGRLASDFNCLVPGMVAAGYRTAVIDYPGYSPWYTLEAARAAGKYTLERLADELAEVAKALRKDGEPVVLLGWAYGNRPVRMAAHRHPDLARAVVVVSAGQAPGFTRDVKLALMAVFQGVPKVGRPMYSAAVRYSCLFSPDDQPPAPVPQPLMEATEKTPEVQKLLGDAKRPNLPGQHDWIAAGGRPLLCIGGVADRIAPPAQAGTTDTDVGSDDCARVGSP